MKLLLIPALVLAAACSELTGIRAALSYAAAKPDCGPVDQAALSLYFSAAPIDSVQPAPPFVAVTVYQPLENLVGHSALLGADQAYATFVTTAYPGESATSGIVTVDKVLSDSTVTGTLWLRFPSSGLVTARFQARWFPRTYFCG